jgi:hypothetical protein
MADNKRTKMNRDRADWAREAIEAFESATGVDREDALCDLLGDLMHWAAQNGFDFDHELQRGRDHLDVERTGKEM